MSPVVPARSGRRILAALADLCALAGLFGAIAARNGAVHWARGRLWWNLHAWYALAFASLALGYYLASELAFDATPGKLLLRLRVASESGEPATIGQIIGRNLSRVVDGLPAFYLVGIAAVLLTHDHRTVGDRIAHTRVVRAPSRH